MSLAVSIVLGTLILRAAPEGFWSIGFLLYLVLALFHLGLYVRPALVGEKTPTLGLLTYDRIWYTDVALVRAAVVVLLGLLAYGLGTGLRLWSRAHRRPSGATVHEQTDPRSRAAIADLGAVAVLAGVGAWLYLSLTAAGPGFVLDGYLNYLDATSQLPMSACYLLISVGTTLAALRPRRWSVRVAAVALAVFALLALMIGIRGEVLIPVTAAVAVLARDPDNRAKLQRLRRPGARLLLGLTVIGLLLTLSFVQQVRLAGIQAFSSGSTNVEASALDTVDEMGYSIRVVITALEWHEDLKEPYRWGETYYTPVSRALARVMGVDREDASTAYGLMNVEIADRVGAIGGSMIAEAEHNYGRPGVLAILLLVGAVAAGVTSRARSAWSEALLGVIGLMALMHVRNSFAPLFVWGSAGLLLAAAGLLLGRFYPRRRP